MSADEPTRERFARAWAAAVERALPPVNLDRGAARLVDTLQRRKQTKLPVRRRLAFAAAAVLVIALAVVSGRVFFGERALELTVDGKQATVAKRLGDAKPHLVRFSDGSTISLAPESALEVAEVEPRRVAITMQHGAAVFDVVHNDERAWEIGAGPFRVNVLGTAFRIVWQAEVQRFTVEVTRGAVGVAGPLLGSERVISAGVTCAVDLISGQAAFGTDTSDAQPKAAMTGTEVESEAASKHDTRARPTPSVAGRELLAPSGSAPRKEARSSAMDWRDFERQGEFDKAVQEALRTGIDHIYDSAGAEDLMGLARAARLAGRLDISKAALLSCRRRFGGTRDAAMAAYLLGRNAATSEAARWFSTYLAEEPDGPLAREASGRLMEAQFASGQHEAARAQARAYLVRYPSGPHANFAKMVLRD